MDGLDRIVGEIGQAAQKQARSVAENAEAEAGRIIEDAKAAAKAEYDEMQKAANDRAKRVLEAADSAAQLDKSNRRLSERRRLIDTAFEKALEKLCSLPADDYFEAVKKLIVKYALAGEGNVVFNSCDLKRLSPGFEMVANAALPDDKTVKISDKADDSIVGGCRIVYGNIEINCDFRALIDEIRETATANVAHILFDGAEPLKGTN